MRTLRSFLCATATAAILSACGGAPVDTSIPVDDARLLNSELSATYVRARDLLEQSSDTARQLGLVPADVPAEELDADLLRHVLEACFTQTVGYAPNADMETVPRGAVSERGPAHRPLTDRVSVGRVDACDPARMLALEAYLDVVEDVIDEFIIERVLETDVLRVNLKDVLIAQLDALERTSGDAAGELLRLRTISAERRAMAQTSDLTEEERRRVEVDFENISQELDQVESILEQVTSELSDMRQLRRQLVEEAARSIALLGQE